MPRNNVNNNKAPKFIEFGALSSFDLWTFKKKKKKFWLMVLSPKKKVLTYGSFSKKKSFDLMEDGGYLFIFYDNSDKNKWADVPMSQ